VVGSDHLFGLGIASRLRRAGEPPRTFAAHLRAAPPDSRQSHHTDRCGPTYRTGRPCRSPPIDHSAAAGRRGSSRAVSRRPRRRTGSRLRLQPCTASIHRPAYWALRPVRGSEAHSRPRYGWHAADVLRGKNRRARLGALHTTRRKAPAPRSGAPPGIANAPLPFTTRRAGRVGGAPSCHLPGSEVTDGSGSAGTEGGSKSRLPHPEHHGRAGDAGEPSSGLELEGGGGTPGSGTSYATTQLRPGTDELH
jgi:hypothetical protein